MKKRFFKETPAFSRIFISSVKTFKSKTAPFAITAFAFLLKMPPLFLQSESLF